MYKILVNRFISVSQSFTELGSEFHRVLKFSFLTLCDSMQFLCDTSCNKSYIKYYQRISYNNK